MTRAKIMKQIEKKIKNAPERNLVREIHLQIIKFHKELEGLSGREFCEGVNIRLAYKAEFSKMQRLAPKLIAAGLDTSLID